MKQSDFNHLRRLLGWVRCDIGQDPAGQQQTVIDIADKLAIKEIDAEAKARLVESYRRAEGVPVYVRDAVKALEKALAAAGRDLGVDAARATAETRANTGFDPGAGAGREPVLTDEQIRTLILEKIGNVTQALREDATDFARTIEAAVLSKLRAPVADAPLTHRCANCGAVFQGAGCPSCRLAAPVASAPVADERAIEPIDGDLLPAIGSEVLIHLASLDKWVRHTVIGYYVWGDHQGNPWLQRVFVRVRDSKGYLNARMLCDVRNLDGVPFVTDRRAALASAPGHKAAPPDKNSGHSRPVTAAGNADKILRERMAPISEALGLDVMIASASNGVIQIFTFEGGPLVYTIGADGTAILRVSWNQPDAPDTLTVGQVKIISQAASEIQPAPQPAGAPVSAGAQEGER